MMPWQEISVDLIGPWKENMQGIQLTFHALAIIDTVSNDVELIRVNDKTAQHIGQQLSNAWLSRYP
jgi:hypothetical protein